MEHYTTHYGQVTWRSPSLLPHNDTSLLWHRKRQKSTGHLGDNVGMKVIRHMGQERATINRTGDTNFMKIMVN